MRSHASSLSRTVSSGHPDKAPEAACALGSLLARQRELPGARAAYQRAIGSGHAIYVPQAAAALAGLLASQSDIAGARRLPAGDRLR